MSAVVLQLRDREMELKTQIAAITSSKVDSEKAEAEAGEGVGPQVNDQHIADIVAQWTGIPIDKVRHSLLCSPCLQGRGMAKVGGGGRCSRQRRACKRKLRIAYWFERRWLRNPRSDDCVLRILQEGWLEEVCLYWCLWG